MQFTERTGDRGVRMTRRKIEQLKTQMTVEMRLTQIKQVCMGLLDVFANVCAKHNLKWWVDGGTLLGTVRDGHIIPWDDDVDVTMPREDYNKLLVIAQHKPDMFGDRYFFQTANTDSCFEVHAKLRDKYTTALTEREYMGSHNKGMFLDIFPLDNAPELLQVREDVAGFVKTIAKHTGQDIAMTKFEYFDILNDVLTDIHRRHKSSEYIANMAFWRYDRDLIILKKSWYEKTATMQFEDMTVPVPYMTEQVLSTWYGRSWETPQQLNNYHRGYVDPFTSYKEYDGLTKEEFEYLIK